ncbi:MAG TPA: glycosyltransferase family 2 protein [Bryobacteraceae bacterium]|nr:glycosyltransferase family 2 protein [Bryobacteraceae bacterium]
MQGWLQAIFVLCVAFTLYTLAGYPLLLAMLARAHSRPVHKKWQPRTVTVLLPVRNGERWIRGKLESLLALRYPRELVQILVISDGSTDRTDEIVQSFADHGAVHLLQVPPVGKALALNAGLGHATGEILFLTDVRQELHPDSLHNLVACFSDDAVGAASGELIIRDGESLEELSVGMYWKYEKWIRRRQSRIDSMLGASGCIYAMRRELAAPLPPGTLADDMFLPLGAFFRGYRIVFDESARAFDYPTALNAEFRRKVRTQAGVYQIIRPYPQLLTPRNRMWLHFVSHKLARLALPYVLLLAFATSFALPDPWKTIALSGQAIWYGLALADLWLPDRFPLKRLTSATRSFVVLMAAALCAVSVIFTPSGRLWKETRVHPTRPIS